MMQFCLHVRKHISLSHPIYSLSLSPLAVSSWNLLPFPSRFPLYSFLIEVLSPNLSYLYLSPMEVLIPDPHVISWSLFRTPLVHNSRPFDTIYSSLFLSFFLAHCDLFTALRHPFVFARPIQVKAPFETRKPSLSLSILMAYFNGLPRLFRHRCHNIAQQIYKVQIMGFVIEIHHIFKSIFGE